MEPVVSDDAPEAVVRTVAVDNARRGYPAGRDGTGGTFKGSGGCAGMAESPEVVDQLLTGRDCGINGGAREDPIELSDSSPMSRSDKYPLIGEWEWFAEMGLGGTNGKLESSEEEVEKPDKPEAVVAADARRACAGEGGGGALAAARPISV